jgi:hypothetical protein
MQRKLEVRKNAFEENKEWAAFLAGPAGIETFGKEPFSPVPKATACKLSSTQQQMQVEFRSQSMMTQMQYINPEERSFTIIAFPDTHIGEQFDELFDFFAVPRYDGIEVNIIHNQALWNKPFKAYVSQGARNLKRIDPKTNKVYWDKFSVNIVPLSAQVLPE